MKSFRKSSISYMSKVAIFAALSIVLYYVKMPATLIIPVFPEYLDIQFSNLPAIICGFVVGPVGGVTVVVIRSLIKLPFTGTLGVGELADLVIGVSCVLISSLVYKKEHTKTGGIIALVCAFVSWVVFAAIANWLIIIPSYMKLFHLDAGYFVNLLSFVNGVTEQNFMLYYILAVAIPFNAMLAFIVCVITYFVYKRVSKLMQKLDGKFVDGETEIVDNDSQNDPNNQSEKF